MLTCFVVTVFLCIVPFFLFTSLFPTQFLSLIFFVARISGVVESKSVVKGGTFGLASTLVIGK